jgi:hypothetical protein
MFAGIDFDKIVTNLYGGLIEQEVDDLKVMELQVRNKKNKIKQLHIIKRHIGKALHEITHPKPFNIPKPTKAERAAMRKAAKSGMPITVPYSPSPSKN